MREIFEAYAKSGAMTKKQLAETLQISERSVSNMVRAGKIPVIPHLREHRFDPLKMIETFCKDPEPPAPRSLTIERHKTNGTLKKGYLECL